MATEDRGHSPALKETLLREGHRFAFMQAVRLLNLFLATETRSHADGRPGFRDTFRQDRIRVRPHLSLDFPGADIVEIEERSQGRKADPLYLITAAFLGLYGASSPLPVFYTEDLLDEAREEGSVSRDFLDIINAPFYGLLFRSWIKYRLDIQVAETQDPLTVERLFCLMGMGGEAIRSSVDDDVARFRYIGLLSQRPRSAQGLETLLRDALSAAHLKVVPGIPRLARIPGDQLCRLGDSGNRLGVSCYLGRKVKDRTGRFRIRVGPLSWEQSREWLPGQARFRKLGGLIRFYLDQPLEWDLEVVLAEEDVRTTRIGDDAGDGLGWRSWLFAAETYPGVAKARF